MTSSTLRPLPDALYRKLENPRPSSGQWVTRCPSHQDDKPSLAVRVLPDDKVIIHCHAGCETIAILDALDLRWKDIMGDEPPPKKEDKGEWTPVKDKAGNLLTASAIYSYWNESGDLLYQVVRVNFPPSEGGKTFRQRRPDVTKKSGWTWNLEGVRPILYQLPKVLDAVGRGEEVLVVEGERDVQTAESLGRVATCNSGGAGKFLPDMARVFGNGAHVLVIADADEPGRKHARSVKALIEAEGGIVRIAECADGYKDLTDHVAAGFGLEDLLIIDKPEMPDFGLIWLEDLLVGDEEPYDWLVEGLLERGERFMLTSPEGAGKTTWLRQFAIRVAAGMHPFQDEALPPLKGGKARKVVWMDAENSQRQNRRRFDPLNQMAVRLYRQINPQTMAFFIRPEGLDLSKESDAAWFEERIAITKPDLLVVGPWYRLFVGDPSEEQKARAVIACLDEARARYGFAVMIEAHSPHSEGIKIARNVRPLGSSILLRWPEYGYGLGFRNMPDQHPTEVPRLDYSYADWVPWRGARDERDWPKAFRRSDPEDNWWPWLPTDRRAYGDANFEQVSSEVKKSGKQKAWTREEMGDYDDGPSF